MTQRPTSINCMSVKSWQHAPPQLEQPLGGSKVEILEVDTSGELDLIGKQSSSHLLSDNSKHGSQHPSVSFSAAFVTRQLALDLKPVRRTMLVAMNSEKSLFPIMVPLFKDDRR